MAAFNTIYSAKVRTHRKRRWNHGLGRETFSCPDLIQIGHSDRRTVPHYSVLSVVEFADTRSTVCVVARSLSVTPMPHAREYEAVIIHPARPQRTVQ